MKRSFHLPLTQAVILDASPSQHQVDRPAAPPRQPGAWTQFIERRLNELTNPEPESLQLPTSSIGKRPAIIDNGLPKGRLGPTDHPIFGLRQRLQPITQPEDQDGPRQGDPSKIIGRSTSEVQSDAAEDERHFELASDPNHFSASQRASNTRPASQSSHSRIHLAPTPEPKLSMASTFGQDKGSQFSRPGSSLPNSRQPILSRQVAPSQRRSPMRTNTARVSIPAHERQAILLETAIEEELQNSLPLGRQSVVRKKRTRTIALVIAPIAVLAAIGTGILLRGHIASLPLTTLQVVSHWKATLFPSRPHSKLELKPTSGMFAQSTSIESISNEPPLRSLPTTYGIFASSNGRLVRLEPMNIRLPDSRIAVSGLITKPATVIVPFGSLSFVAYQRELMTSTPDNAQLRVLAKVRTPSPSATEKPVVTASDDTWVIRSVSVDLTVAPAPESREMVELRPVNPDAILSPGRYVLIFKGQTYDFVVDGKVTDKAHCLERTETEDGERFTECRRLP